MTQIKLGETSVVRTPVIIGINGYLSNHHYTSDGLIGDRVTEETATHVITIRTFVEELNVPNSD